MRVLEELGFLLFFSKVWNNALVLFNISGGGGGTFSCTNIRIMLKVKILLKLEEAGHSLVVVVMVKGVFD